MTSTGDAAEVLYEVRGPVALITLNRPEQRNCVNAGMSAGLRAAVKRFEADPALAVAVLAGRGKVFCAGMDLKAFSEGAVGDVLFGEGRFGGFVSLPRSKPVIAAVQGAALAGGFELMLACDMAIAETSAKFGLPEARLGLIAGAGGVFRLAQRISPVKARELVLTGAVFAAEEADRYGLLNRVVADGGALEAALTLAGEIARSAPQSVRDGLSLAKSAELESEARLWERNDSILRDILLSDDAREGASAFKEKRAPVWRGAKPAE